MCLDLGGIGKEYAVDRVLTLALQRGIENVLVDFGNDVRVHISVLTDDQGKVFAVFYGQNRVPLGLAAGYTVELPLLPGHGMAVEDLLQQMTQDEKLGQLNQLFQGWEKQKDAGDNAIQPQTPKGA